MRVFSVALEAYFDLEEDTVVVPLRKAWQRERVTTQYSGRRYRPSSFNTLAVPNSLCQIEYILISVCLSILIFLPVW